MTCVAPPSQTRPQTQPRPGARVHTNDYVGGCTPRQLRQRLRHCVEAQTTCRTELQLAETMAFDELVVRAARSAATAERVATQRLEAENDAIRKAVRIHHRRVQELEHEEARRRAEVYEQSGQLLDAHLRLLERDLRSDVDRVDFHDAQRHKYFLKTHAMIVKKEAAFRRELVNGERYARLVMMQRADAAALRTMLAEKVAGVRESQREKIERMRTTQGGSRSHASNRSDRSGTPRHRSKTLQHVKPRTVVAQHEGFYDRAVQLVEEREEEVRQATRDVENNEFAAIVRGHEHVRGRVEAEARQKAEREQENDSRVKQRHLRELEHAEAGARQTIVVDERASALAVFRKVGREEIAEGRRATLDDARQVTHQRKLEGRHQRMLHTRTHFVERQVLLSLTLRDSPVEQEIFPAFLPKPPELIAVHKHLQRHGPSPTASRSASKAAGGHASEEPLSGRTPHESLPSAMRSTTSTTANPGGVGLAEENEQARAAARRNVATRGLQTQQHAGRLAAEREERLERFAITAEARAVLGKVSTDRLAESETRRTEQQRRRIEQAADHLDSSAERSARAQGQRRREKAHRAAREELAKGETTARVSTKAAEADWWKRFSVYVQAVVGTKMIAAFSSLTQTEEAKRRDLVTLEITGFRILRELFASHKPQSRVVKVVPLPPPRSMSDFRRPKALAESAARQQAEQRSQSRRQYPLARSTRVQPARPHGSAASSTTGGAADNGTAPQKDHDEAEKKVEEEEEPESSSSSSARASSDDRSSADEAGLGGASSADGSEPTRHNGDDDDQGQGDGTTSTATSQGTPKHATGIEGEAKEHQDANDRSATPGPSSSSGLKSTESAPKSPDSHADVDDDGDEYNDSFHD